MTLESQIEAEKNTLKQITEVRPVDVTKAQADLQKAIAARNRAKQEFAYATVSAPQNGEILKIIAHPGDKVGDQGLLEMADTSSMVVNSEVYQTDMPKIFIGQMVTITADGFNGSVAGHVYQINRLVKQQTVFNGKPGENLDMRVFEVKIKLDPSIEEKSKFKYASNMQVNVVFEPKEEKSNP
jgi:HlyD family secretion protein